MNEAVEQPAAPATPDIIDEYLKHELIDRVFCVSTMFDQLITDHPAAALLRKEIDEVSLRLGTLYQEVGSAIFVEEHGEISEFVSASASMQTDATQ